MAPQTRRRKAAPDAAAPAIDPADRLSKLPDEILAQILSLLPAQEAVRTCVLGRTWRDVWKMTKRLLITVDSVREVREFVDHLLRVRVDGLKLAPLDACEIEIDVDKDGLDDEDLSSVNSWIRRVLKCDVQTLRVDTTDYILRECYLQLSPLVSPHLTRLELEGVVFEGRCLNLEGCPALEHLEMKDCCLPGVVTSPSIKRLGIKDCDANCYGVDICVPRLVSLWLKDLIEWTPLPESMPDLVRARVEIGSEISDIFNNFDDDAKCYILQGLAAAEDLEMIVSPNSTSSKADIFQRDLRWCPTFSKLKTLVLDHDLCESETAGCTLACILEHAPFLEKLTIIFSYKLSGKYNFEVKGHLNETVKSAIISQHLKIVGVKCDIVDGKVLNILKLFGTCFQMTVQY